ncbi:MAG TPA: phosphoribosylanthranilate isomerase [Nitrospirales bacterium]|nr:phosphoribosylanthranilate isomerase [Nitrospirales bacterium]
MLRVKICGITNVDDALHAVDAGADALGFIFYPESLRCVTPDIVRRIIERLPPFTTPVGVFVNEDRAVIQRVIKECGLSLVQLHGDESPDDCLALGRPVIKAIRLRSRDDIIPMRKYAVSGFVLDACGDGIWGGTGKMIDWELAREATRHAPTMLAGGLTPDNVGRAVAEVRPFGVDVSSGVEISPGKKDFEKVRQFILAARKGDG